MALTRITITIPLELLEAADRRAGELSRSRSWILSEALKGYLNPDAHRVAAVREPTAVYGTGLGASRQAQLEADLALTAEERILIGEQSALIADLRGRRPPRDQVIAFDRYESFLDWKKREALEP
jgi:predicted transcriptional regulator